MRLMRLFNFLFIFAACSTGGHKTPSQNLPDPLKLDVTSFRLQNGLTVLVVENHALPIYAFYSFYKVGGKDERKGITGASHFLEHLMFKGTKTMSASKFDFLVEGNGGTTNAYTTNDFTVYHENMPANTLEMMLKVEADRMVNLKLDAKEFEHERKVVLEERKMRYENSPRGQVYLNMMQEMFRGTPYGTSVIGDIEDLNTVSRNQIYQYYRQWYAPNNATIVIAGDVDPSQVKSWVEKYYGGLPASKVPEDSRGKVPASAFQFGHKVPIEKHLKGQSASPLFMVAFPGEPIGTPRGYAMDILSSILGDGKSAHLVQKFTLSKAPKASSIYAGNYTLEKAGTFMVGGELVRGVKPSSFKADLLTELVSSCDKAITDTALQKVKNNYEKNLFGELDTNAGVAQFIGDRQAYFGDWAYYRKELQIYQALTVAEVRKACKEVFADQRYVWVTVWERNKGEN
jgi:zinc protease